MKVLGLFYQIYGPYDSYFLIPRDHSMFTHVEIKLGENRRLVTNEPIGLDKKTDMDGCSRMDIQFIKGTNQILTGTHFEFPDVSWNLCVSPRILIVPPPWGVHWRKS
jgi:hypothetical protein